MLPKVCALQIIDELEPNWRGIYAGTVGYLGATGAINTCIALLRVVLKDDKIYVKVQAGRGVVADSIPEGEYQEHRNKARALVRVAEETVRFASQKSNI